MLYCLGFLKQIQETSYFHIHKIYKRNMTLTSDPSLHFIPASWFSLCFFSPKGVFWKKNMNMMIISIINTFNSKTYIKLPTGKKKKQHVNLKQNYQWVFNAKTRRRRPSRAGLAIDWGHSCLSCRGDPEDWRRKERSKERENPTSRKGRKKNTELRHQRRSPKNSEKNATPKRVSKKMPLRLCLKRGQGEDFVRDGREGADPLGTFVRSPVKWCHLGKRKGRSQKGSLAGY